MPNYNELAAFAAVVREGSFTRAAAQLGVTPSALSHGVRNLERRLGLTLLHRSTRSVAATEVGQRLYQSVGPRLQDIAQELDVLVAPAGEVAGKVRINAPDLAVHTLIWPRLSPLLAAHPGLWVEVHSDNRFTDIVAGGYDIGVRLGADVAQDMIAARIGADMLMAVAGSPAHLAAHGEPRTPQALDARRCLGFRLPTHDNLLAWEFSSGQGRVFSLQPQGRVVCNQPQTLLQAACDGHGLVWLPRDLLQPLLAQDRLRTVLDDAAMVYPGYHLYYAERRASPAMKQVIQALRGPWADGGGAGRA